MNDSVPSPPSQPRRPQVLWLNIPRPEEVVVLFVIFAIVVYLLFIVTQGGHLLSILMAFTASILSCIAIVGLGRVAQIISDRRRAASLETMRGAVVEHVA